MRHTRTLRNRLAGLFALIVLGAIAVVYVSVVPPLEQRLLDERLSGLAADAGRFSGDLEGGAALEVPEARLQRFVRTAAERSGERVTLLGVAGTTSSPQINVIVDSDTPRDQAAAELNFPAADVAQATGVTSTDTEPTVNGRVGEAARPAYRAGGQVLRVVVFSARLADVQANVALIRREILQAGALGLAAAILAGYLVARALSARVRRLQQAAGRVAAGDFSQRIEVDGSDELTELMRSFDEMQTQLGELDDARKRFIATASHELRTPIFSLGGFLELLADEELDDETRAQFVEQLRGQVERLRRLTVELLDLSRLEAGSLELHPERVDLAELAEMVAAEFSPAAAEHHSELELRGEAAVPATLDPERVAQVVRILVDNALVHTPAGTPVTVRTERDDGRVRVAVRDHGPGVQAAALERLFDPFYTTGDGRGAGLGLAIARELALRMDGELAVRSRPGATTFTLELPG